MDTPKKRRRIAVVHFEVDQLGQYEALTIRLPENASRLTGVMITATQLTGGVLASYHAWVIYGAPNEVPGAVLQRWYNATRYNRLPSGQAKLSGEATNPEGFETDLTDELVLRLLTPPLGKSVYVFYPVELGTATFVDKLGLVVNPVHEPTITPLPPVPADTSTGGSSGPCWVYEMPQNAKVYFPPTFIR